MAKFKVTDPETGKTVTVTGDAPPSQDDAEEIFKNAGLRGSEYGAGVGRAGELASGKYGEGAPELPDPGYVQDQWGNIGAESLKEAGLQMRERQPGVAEDVIRTLPGAILKTGTQFPGLFGDSYAMGGVGAGAATDRQTDYSKTLARFLPTSQGIAEAIARPFGGVYEPKTWQGKLLDTTLPFSPAAAVKSQLKSLPGRIAQRTARVVAPAVLSEGAGELAQGSPLEAPARIGGAILGSAAAEGAPAMGGALRQAGRAASDLIPITRGAQDRYAARLARAAATDPANFERVVKNLQLPQNRLESTRTTAELTGDTGQYELQAKMAGQFPGDAAAKRTEQRDAERAHIEKASGTGAPGDLADHIVQTVRDIDERNADAAKAGLEEAKGRGDAFPQRTAEEYGAPLQKRAAAERAPVADATSRIWEAIDPDKNLITDVSPAGAAADKVLAGVSQSSLGLEGNLAALVEKARTTLRGTQRFFDLNEYRKDLVQAMREERVRPGGGEHSPTFRRLQILNEGVEDSLRTAIETKVGGLSREEQIAFDDELRGEAERANPALGSRGADREQLRASVAGTEGGGAAGDQAQGSSTGQSSVAPGDSGVSAPAVAVRPKARKFEDEVTGRGGIKVTNSKGEVTPEGQVILNTLGLNERKSKNLTKADKQRLTRLGKLVNTKGGGVDPKDLADALRGDQWFTDAAEATEPGQLPPGLVNLLERQKGGGAVFHPEDEGLTAANAKADPQLEEKRLNDQARAFGIPPKKPTERLSTFASRVGAAAEIKARSEQMRGDPNYRQFGEENRQQLAAGREATRDLKERFDEGVVGDITQPKPYGGFAMDESQVAKQVFKPGDGGAETLSAYRRAVGDTDTLRIIEDYAGSQLRKFALNADGTINKTRADLWLKNHEPAMRQFPELEQRIRAAASSTERMGEIAAQGKLQRQRFETRAVKKLMDRQTGEAIDDADVPRAIGTMLANPKRATDLKQIAALARQDASGNATRGLQRAIGDHIIEKFLKPESSKSVAQNFRAFIRQNESFLGDIVGPETLKSWKQLATRLEEQARALPAARPGRLDEPLLRQLSRHAVSATLGGLGSGAALGSLVSGGLGGLAAAFGVQGVRWLRAQGFKNGDQILSEAVNNPEAMKALLERVPANGPDKGAVRRLFNALGKGALVGGVQGYMSSQQARPDTEGKPVPKSYADTLSQYARPTAP